MRSSLNGDLYADAYKTKGTVQASRLCCTGPVRTEVLRPTQGDASGRGTICSEQRLRSYLAESQEAVSCSAPAVHRVHEGRAVREGNGGRPHNATPW